MNSIGTILLTTLDTKFKEVKVVRENMIGITTENVDSNAFDWCEEYGAARDTLLLFGI